MYNVYVCIIENQFRRSVDCGGFLKRTNTCGKVTAVRVVRFNRFSYASFTSNRRCSVSLNQWSDQKLSCEAFTTTLKYKPF